MPAASARERSSSAGLLSIGQVLARLSPEFPTLTSSKLRFLEVRGIVTPLRTESGYRKFSPDDLERLRARAHHAARPLPAARGHPRVPRRRRRRPRPGTARTAVGAAVDRAGAAPLPPRGAAAAAGAAPQLLNDAISTGVLVGAETLRRAVGSPLLRALVALDRHGIEPRHLRGLRQSAERELALIESALAPLLRRTDAASRGTAGELAGELAKRLDEVRATSCGPLSTGCCPEPARQ